MKKDLLSGLFSLTKLQSAALKNEDMDEFSIIMEKKQIFMDKINEISNHNLNVLDEEETAILLQIAEVDKQNKEEFNRQFEDTKLQLCKIRALKKRDSIYANPYDVFVEEGFFIDKKQGE